MNIDEELKSIEKEIRDAADYALTGPQARWLTDIADRVHKLHSTASTAPIEHFHLHKHGAMEHDHAHTHDGGMYTHDHQHDDKRSWPKYQAPTPPDEDVRTEMDKLINMTDDERAQWDENQASLKDLVM